MKIVTICGAGMGTSAILKVNVERVLKKMGRADDVVAADVGSVGTVAADAQVILTSQHYVEAIGKTWADVIVIDNFLDLTEIESKLEDALG